MIECTINGKNIKVEPGTTILQAATKNGIYIPNLCYDKRLRPYGGCRLCVVEVEGQKRLFAACSTPAEEGMAILTETPKLAKARKMVLELLLVHHPLDCPICDKAGECSLQDLAFKYGPSQSRFVGRGRAMRSGSTRPSWSGTPTAASSAASACGSAMSTRGRRHQHHRQGLRVEDKPRL
ncbi:MAG: 2Fe-2S iron-sulfur cluster-binding protein [Thermodesulfovibrionales bacterium]